ncbi:MAG: hypothetical protein H0V62_09785 [Gammaproteobacteria bacterium]|nr:hypothetical protein [Gammaproteobacteria bacterium]MBA3732255.1 hypothetical protein [Gammaproteobacteria bacterium]
MRENQQPAGDTGHRTSPALIAIAWLAVMLPLAWGFVSTLIEASALFT